MGLTKETYVLRVEKSACANFIYDGNESVACFLRAGRKENKDKGKDKGKKTSATLSVARSRRAEDKVVTRMMKQQE